MMTTLVVVGVGESLLEAVASEAEALVIAVRDPNFDAPDLLARVRAMTVNRPDVVATLALTLAAGCRPERLWADVDAAVWEHDHERPSEWCGDCGCEIAPATVYQQLGVRRKSADAQCQACYQVERRRPAKVAITSVPPESQAERRELVARLTAAGRSTNEIATVTGLSRRTVTRYRARALEAAAVAV